MKPLLTDNELSFLHCLETAAPELRFHAQVAMGALINPSIRRYTQGSDYYRLRSQFSQKIVDFVAQNRADGRIIAVIELDDRTHDASKDAQRDIMLCQAGYKVVRWHSRLKPDASIIREELLGVADSKNEESFILKLEGYPQRFLRMLLSIIIGLSVVFTIISFIGLGIFWYGVGDISDFIDVDRCMDRGGAVRGKYCELEPGKFVPLDCYGTSCTTLLSQEELD